jgi:cholesterol transport system auxiliary component
MNRNLRTLRPLTFAIIVLSLAGCSKLFTEAPRPLFRLTAPNDFSASLPHSNAQIVIATPYAPAGLDTQRIAMARSPESLDYLADGEWTDRAPAVVRTALIEAFENSKAVAAVGPDSLDLRADFVIEGDLRHFEAVYDSQAGGAGGAPSVWVAIAVKLVKVPEHKILAQTLIAAHESAAANATPQIVDAFNGAMASVAKQVVAWTLTNPALSAPHR